jgi:hypothetical protein
MLCQITLKVTTVCLVQPFSFSLFCTFIDIRGQYACDYVLGSFDILASCSSGMCTLAWY